MWFYWEFKKVLSAKEFLEILNSMQFVGIREL